ncbi:MAG: N-glycosylase/DNA lyase [Candidatus Thermoplasmatota archaeon]|jgi:N-glycosylase/DNA lyase|nr:N-glycosylase/DNA lyase [Candidatus Thermoplasmatota archaeon]
MEFHDEITSLILSPSSSDILEKRDEFILMRNAPAEELFSELCFCILAANTSAEMGLRTQKVVGIRRLISLSESDLSRLLHLVRYRFYNVRSKFIVGARSVMNDLPEIVRSSDLAGSREYLVENVPGIGYKEASHFLRNVGVFKFAILDKHIQSILSEMLNIRIGSMTSKRYIEIEEKMIEISEKYSMEPGIFDLYLWKIATGSIIK